MSRIAVSIFAFLFPTSVLADGFPVQAPGIVDAWEAYTADPACDGVFLTPLLEAMQTRMEVAEGMLLLDQATGSTDGMDFVLKNAAGYNAIGQGALDKGCPNEAREIFLSVIDRFQGETYAASRDRAKIGIDDARAVQ